LVILDNEAKMVPEALDITQIKVQPKYGMVLTGVGLQQLHHHFLQDKVIILVEEHIHGLLLVQ
jgi:hypothetical protein